MLRKYKQVSQIWILFFLRLSSPLIYGVRSMTLPSYYVLLAVIRIVVGDNLFHCDQSRFWWFFSGWYCKYIRRCFCFKNMAQYPALRWFKCSVRPAYINITVPATCLTVIFFNLLPICSVLMQVSVFLRWFLCQYRHVPACRRIYGSIRSRCFCSSHSTFRTSGFDAESLPSLPTFSVLSSKHQLFPLGRLKWRLFRDTSFIGDLSSLGDFDINFRRKTLLSVVRTVCLVPSRASFGCS